MVTKPGHSGASHSSVQFAGLWAMDSSLMGPHALSTSAKEYSAFQVLLTMLSLLLSILPFCFHILFVSELQSVCWKKILGLPPYHHSFGKRRTTGNTHPKGTNSPSIGTSAINSTRIEEMCSAPPALHFQSREEPRSSILPSISAAPCSPYTPSIAEHRWQPAAVTS